MAESFVNVTEGSGKKLHTFARTIGANAVEDEVVVLGEQYLATYLVAPAAFITTATANSHLLQIMAGASLRVRIRRIELHQVGLATTAALMDTRIYRLTSAGTGGTTHGLGLLDPADAAAGASAMTLPTAKGTESSLFALAAPYLMQTLAASAPLWNPVLAWDFDRPRSKPLTIPAGVTNGIAIKNITAVAGASLFVNVWLDESNF
jgi:hypothetical protein